MNIHAIYHAPQSEYAFPISRDRAVLRLRTAAGDAAKAEVAVRLKYNERLAQTVQMAKRFTDSLFDYYECEIDTDRGRRVYFFILTGKDGERVYYTELGASLPEEVPAAYFPYFQIPFVSDGDIFTVPDKFKNAVIYQIFPDRFYTDSPKLDWKKRPTPSDMFGGDLRGIAKKLDYIKSMGFDTLYLNPINPSKTNHRYDVEDYYRVAPELGGDDAFAELMQKAHAAGIKVMLDGVFNHCSMFNPIFRDVAEKGKNSEYYDWFLIDGDRVKTDSKGIDVKNCNYQTFAWKTGYMPKLNCDNGKVRDFVADVTSFWIKKFGIDAWRLDVADDVSPALWRQVRSAVKAADKNAILIGEDWMDPRPFLGGDVFDGVMNYGFLRAVRDWLAYKATDAKGAADRLIRTYNRTNRQSAEMMMNLIGSHDTHRFFTLCGRNLFDYKAAVATMFFFDGMPTVYYGDELPLEGDADPDCRRGFDWNRTGGEVSALITELAHMRANEHAGTVMGISADNGALVITRSNAKSESRLTVNATKNDVRTANGVVKARSALIEKADGGSLVFSERV